MRYKIHYIMIIFGPENNKPHFCNNNSNIKKHLAKHIFISIDVI